MSNLDPKLSIKGTPLSGRVWKIKASPVRSRLNPNIRKKSEDKIKSKWQKAQQLRNVMKEIAKDSRELIEKDREIKKNRSKQIKLKRLRKQENEIKTAGNVVIVSPAKAAKMTKKARKKLNKITPEMLNIILRGRKK